MRRLIRRLTLALAMLTDPGLAYNWRRAWRTAGHHTHGWQR